MAKGGQEYRQLTVRFPTSVWADLSQSVQDEGGASMNEVVVRAVRTELERRRRARLLERIERQRVEIAGRWGAAEDSVPYIRALREGQRDREDL